MLADHEAGARRVDEVGALAPYRLGDQGLLALGAGPQEEDRGVELDEFEVGDLRSGAQGECHTVARGDRGVGRRGEDLAHASGREDDGGRADRADSVVLALAHDVQGDACRTALGVRQQVQDQSVLDRTESRRPDRIDQCAGDLRARGVAARVGDAAAVVAAFAGELEVALGGGVEVGAGGDQPSYGVGAFGDQGADRVRVAESGPRDQRVVQVLLGGVALAERGRDAALGPAGGAVVQVGLGDDDGAQTGCRAAQGGGEACHTGADNHDVGVDRPAGGRCVQAYAGRGSGSCCGRVHGVPPKVSGMLSMRRVVPTLAATARIASPVWSSGASVKSDGSIRAR